MFKMLQSAGGTTVLTSKKIGREIGWFIEQDLTTYWPFSKIHFTSTLKGLWYVMIR